MTDQSEIDWTIQQTEELEGGMGSKRPRDSITIEKLRRERMDGLKFTPTPFKRDNKVQLVKDAEQSEESGDIDAESEEECHRLMDNIPEFEKRYSGLQDVHDVNSDEDELTEELETRGRDWLHNQLININPELDTIDEPTINTLINKKDNRKTLNGASEKNKDREEEEKDYQRLKSGEIRKRETSTPRSHHKTNSKIPPQIRPKSGNIKLPNYVRKPEILKHGQSWRQFLSSFKNYAEIVGIPDNQFIKILMSFMSPALAEKVAALNLSERQISNPQEALKILHPILDGPSNFVINRILLSKMKQGDQSITTFAENIRIKSLLCQFENEEIRSTHMIQSFLNGLTSPEVCKEILKNDPPVLIFEDAVRLAVNCALANDAFASFDGNRGDEAPIPVYTVGQERDENEYGIQEWDEKDAKIRELETMIANLQGSWKGSACSNCGDLIT